jgi:RHS repeat-associated protein
MGRQTVWRYDVEGRVTGKRYADGSETMLVHDSTRRLKARYDEQGQVTVFEYYPDDRLKRASYPNASVPTASVSYIYDPDYPRVLAMMDGIGTTVYSYYPITPVPVLGASRLASIVGPLINSTVIYQYDAVGRVVSRAVNGVALATTYDVEGRESMVTNVLGAFQYAYVGATARYASEAYPNGQTNLYSYYGNAGDRRLAQVVHLKPDGSLLSGFGYAYNAVGQIYFWTNILDTSPQTFWTLGYDAGDQLTRGVLALGAMVQESHTYGYDLVGNRLSEDLLGATNHYTYDALNELVVGPGDTNATYEWDGEHRLTAINRGTQRLECSYDGLGRRVGIRTLVNGVEVTNRFFLWCGSEICEEHTAAGAISKRFFEQGVKLEAGPAIGPLYYTRDHLNSVRELTDSGGTLRARYAYDPFGRRTRVAGDIDTDFGFAGMFWSIEAGINLTWYRAYDPELGRWLSRDPLENGELDEGINLYAYVRNNPVNVTDSLGLQCCQCAKPCTCLKEHLAHWGILQKFQDCLETNIPKKGTTVAAKICTKLWRQKLIDALKALQDCIRACGKCYCPPMFA